LTFGPIAVSHSLHLIFSSFYLQEAEKMANFSGKSEEVCNLTSKFKTCDTWMMLAAKGKE